MNRDRPASVPFGDAAVLVRLAEGVDEETTRRVHRLARALDALHRRDPRFGSPVPAYGSVLVPVDPIDPGAEAGVRVVDAVVAEADMASAPDQDGAAQPPIDIPTRYGGTDGPDLEDVAALHDLRPLDVVEIHASTEYLVHFLGFAPGFAYLGRVPDRIVTPRLATPRARVPAGSVGIAGEQTGIYPFESPGGWRLIGRTDLRIWDPARNPPALLVPGRRVRFVPLTR